MLHTVNKSPTDKLSLMSCLRLAKSGSDILLIEDGVYAAMRGTSSAPLLERALKYCQVYVLEPDLDLRGLDESKLIDGIQATDYAGFVALAVRNNAVHAWL